MYLLVGDLAAQRGVDFLEEVVFGKSLVPAARWIVHHLVPWPWWQALLVGEYGLLTMALPYAFAIILPIVGTFFLFFGFIEDVGYLPRLAVMANRFCRLLGLNGKAVLPLVLGLGCDTMATMTTRILDSKRDRLITTLLLALGIPCSAQLGVIMAMLAGLPPLAFGIWLAIVLGMTVVVGQAASRVLPGEASPFLYEIPPLRRPKLSNILIKTIGRLEWYVKEAVPLFFLGTLVLFLLDAFGALVVLERLASPLVVQWLGLPVKATEAFLVGFLRRDFGAAGFYALQRAGQLNGVQIVVSLVTITLFVPCIAQYFMMVKERGWKSATALVLFVLGTALVVGGILFRLLTTLGVRL
jgi:ferrous iron transport protein B